MQKDKELSQRRKGILALWLVAIGVIALITLLSTELFSYANTKRLLGPFNNDLRRIAHVTEFACLFLVLRLALNKTFSRSGHLLHGLTAVLLSAAIALADEWHQSFVPARTASWSDVLLDVQGVLAGLALWLAFRIFWKLRFRIGASGKDR